MKLDATFSKTAKTRSEIKDTLRKKVPEKQKENIEKYKKVLFLNFKDTLDNSIVANNYLFELSKDIIKKNKIYNGLYKIDIIKKDEKGITCRMAWGNYRKEFVINNEEIMQKKPEKDRLEDEFSITKSYHDNKGEKIKKTRPGRKEDFLDEIEYGDSVIIDIQDDNIKKIKPDDIIEEIGNYIKENDNNYIKAKKIQTAMKFFNESKEQLSSQYIKDFFNKLVREKQSKWNKGKTFNQLKEDYPKHKEYFAEVLKRFLNKEQLYVHKENDIDKSAVKFLLTKKFWIKPEKIFNEVDRNDAENKDEWVFFDILGTKHGMKTIEKVTGKTEKWKNIKKRKKIISEHTDASDEALLSNRPSSTTQMVFKIFKELWTIDKETLPQIQRFVNFVNAVDSMDYQISNIDYPNNYQTLFGLYRNLNIQDIFEYFKDPEHTGFERLPEWYLKKTQAIRKNSYGDTKYQPLKILSEEHQQRIQQNIKNFEELQKTGKELEYKNTKFIVDMEEKIKDGPQTAGYHKDEKNNRYGYFTIRSKRGNIYMYSPKKLPVMIEWFPTEGQHFLILNDPTFEDLKKILGIFKDENPAVKNAIVDRLREIQKKKDIKTITKEDINLRISKILPQLTEKDLKEHRIYKGIINNMQDKSAYITLDNKGAYSWKINVEEKQDLKQYGKWDLIKVRIEEIKQNEWKNVIILSMIPAKE